MLQEPDRANNGARCCLMRAMANSHPSLLARDKYRKLPRQGLVELRTAHAQKSLETMP